MSASHLLPPLIHPPTHWPHPSHFVSPDALSCRLQQTFWVHREQIGRAGPLGPGQCPNKGETFFFNVKPTPEFRLTASAHCFSFPTGRWGRSHLPPAPREGVQIPLPCGGQRILLKNLTNVSYLHNPVKRNLCRKRFCIWYINAPSFV